MYHLETFGKHYEHVLHILCKRLGAYGLKESTTSRNLTNLNKSFKYFYLIQ